VQPAAAAATGTDGLLAVAVPLPQPAQEITEIDIQRAGFGVL
jgi:HSP20 family molecular chaperone IbpA